MSPCLFGLRGLGISSVMSTSASWAMDFAAAGIEVDGNMTTSSPFIAFEKGVENPFRHGGRPLKLMIAVDTTFLWLQARRDAAPVVCVLRGREPAGMQSLATFVRWLFCVLIPREATHQRWDMGAKLSSPLPHLTGQYGTVNSLFLALSCVQRKSTEPQKARVGAGLAHFSHVREPAAEGSTPAASTNFTPGNAGIF